MKTKLILGIAAGTILLISCRPSKPKPNDSNTAVQRCVDQANRVVDDKFCEEVERKRDAYLAQPGHRTTDSFFQQYLLYHWLFGGQRGFVPIGGAVYGGTATRPATPFFVRPTSSPSDPTIVERSGARVDTRSSFAAAGSEGGTARGVFGSAGEAAAGHGGGGGE